MTTRKSRGRQPETITPLDFHIAARLRTLRESHGRSRAWLAEATGLRENQIFKLETNKSRVFASRLLDFAEVFDVHPGYFYEGFEIGSRVVPPYQRGDAGGEDDPGAALERAEVRRVAVRFAALPPMEREHVRRELRYVEDALKYREMSAEAEEDSDQQDDDEDDEESAEDETEG